MFVCSDDEREDGCSVRRCMYNVREFGDTNMNVRMFTHVSKYQGLRYKRPPYSIWRGSRSLWQFTTQCYFYHNPNPFVLSLLPLYLTYISSSRILRIYLLTILNKLRLASCVTLISFSYLLSHLSIYYYLNRLGAKTQIRLNALDARASHAGPATSLLIVDRWWVDERRFCSWLWLRNIWNDCDEDVNTLDSFFKPYHVFEIEYIFEILMFLMGQNWT